MKNKNLLLPISIIVSGIVIGGAIIISYGGFNSIEKDELKVEINNKRPQPQAQDPSTPSIISQENIELEGWPFLGDVNAPITIVEYSDYACPFCGRFASETLPLLKRDYIDEGIVRFVYKDFAVVGGERASEAAHCANEQGKYWEYHDILFENLTSDRANWNSSEIHKSYANQLGLNADDLVNCFNERRYQQKVNRSTQEAISNGGTGTPYFLINGVPVSGAQPYLVFQEIIDELLN